MNILVTGENGQLGSSIKEISNKYPYKFIFTSRDSLDITNKYLLKKFIDKSNIDLIINCSAYTAVDRAEKDIEVANLVNNIAVRYLSDISKANNISLIHISTDYVFDGKGFKPYREDDKLNPQNIYGISKLKGEQYFIESGVSGVIIRTSWVYSKYNQNFVKTMLSLKNRDSINVVSDQIGTPTYARDLAETILNIAPKIQNSKSKIYHYSNEGVASWFDFAKAIFKLEDIDIKLNPISSENYPTLATRPHYSVLNKQRIKDDFNIEIPYWRDSLETMLKELR